MIISHSCIEAIKDRAAIAEVVGHFVQLKQNKACCPFHAERSPSFTVNPVRNRYKCFGCGASGDPVQFVMETEGLGYVEAIRWLAKFYNVTLEYEEQTEEQKKISESKESMYQVNEAAAKHYQEQLGKNTLAREYLLNDRGIHPDTLDEFEIGFAPDDFKFISSKAIAAGLYDNALALDLIREKEGNVYDRFRNRIMFPIRNRRGRISGFGSRVWQKDQEGGKYVNSSDSPIYNKQFELYGLHQARKSIYQKKEAILVEGNIDVLMMHQSGFTNTVGICGTAFTEGHLQLLKDVSSLMFIPDQDVAGIKSFVAALTLCLALGKTVRVVELPQGVDKDDKYDPDRMCRELSADDWKKYVIEHTRDAVLWRADALLAGELTPVERTKALKDVAALINAVDDETLRCQYADKIKKTHKLKRELSTLIRKDNEPTNVPGAGDENNHYKFPDGVDVSAAYTDGFFALVDRGNTGYYFNNGSSFVRQSNFVMRPLFHIDSDTDNKRLIEIDNGFAQYTLDPPSKAMISLELFKDVCWSKGNFLFYGNATNLMKVLNKLGSDFPKCTELTTLGWQSEGFFAFNNAIYNGKLSEFDEYGIVLHSDKRYFSPSVSKIYAQAREGDDVYENDRYLAYRQTSLRFEQWCDLMNKVYPGKAEVAIACVFIALNSDLVYKTDNSVPMGHFYGQKGSGKSKYAESIANVFTNQMPFFNLNMGTDFALHNLVGRFANCAVWFEEFDDNGLKEERFQTVKGFYDRAARQRGKGVKNKTEMMKVRCMPIMTGQYLSTRDDNSVLSRCLVMDFVPNDKRSQDQIDNYLKLKDYEKEGLNGILTQLMPFRKDLEKEFAGEFYNAFKDMRSEFHKLRLVPMERVLRNYSVMLAMLRFYGKRIPLPFNDVHAMEYCIKWVHKLTSLINESDMLADFWRTLELLVETQTLLTGLHYKIVSRMHASVQVSREKVEERQFTEVKRILFLRMNIAHGLYEESFRRRTGRAGINASSLHLYLSNHPSYIGTCKSERFSGSVRKSDGSGVETVSTTTSCLMFDYSLLQVDLDRSDGANDDVQNGPVPAMAGEEYNPPRQTSMQDDLPF